MAVAVVPTLPAAPPLAVPAPEFSPVPFEISALKLESSEDTTLASVPMPLTVTLLVFPVSENVLSNEPVIVPTLLLDVFNVSVISALMFSV